MADLAVPPLIWAGATLAVLLAALAGPWVPRGGTASRALSAEARAALMGTTARVLDAHPLRVLAATGETLDGQMATRGDRPGVDARVVIVGFRAGRALLVEAPPNI